MATETFEIDSPLSPEAALERMIDLTRSPEWDHGIRDCRMVGGEFGSVGARYELTVTGFDGQPTTAVYEITEVRPGIGFTMVGHHPDFRADDTVTIEPTADGCRVRYDAGLVLLGEDPPLSEDQLGRLFSSIVAVPREGLRSFLG